LTFLGKQLYIPSELGYGDRGSPPKSKYIGAANSSLGWSSKYFSVEYQDGCT